MAHLSENAVRLTVEHHCPDSLNKIPVPNLLKPEVWFFILPEGRSMDEIGNGASWLETLDTFATSLNEASVLILLTTPEDAAASWSKLCNNMQYQLLVSVKLSEPINAGQERLPIHHSDLLVLSKYRASLKHTKTRQQYTYCPACNKTTKDYGGKKHLYHEYGTALSDVWRDLSYVPGSEPVEITDRLCDLFGTGNYDVLKLVDLRKIEILRPNPSSTHSNQSRISPRSKVATLNSELVVGDVMQALGRIPSNSIDFCFADPPYNLAKRYDTWDDSLNADEYLAWCDLWIDELARVLKPGGSIAILNIPVLAMRHFEHMQKSLTFQNWITWDGLSLPVRNIMPANYSIVTFSKGSPRKLPGLSSPGVSDLEQFALTTQKENFCVRSSCLSARVKQGIIDREPVSDLWWDTHRLKHNSRRVDHPCQLPPTLMRRLIALFSAEGEIVLDPFNGAGTTTLCAAQLNRKYIGIELSEKYHEIASERHSALALGEDPFGKVADGPKAKNSRVGRVTPTKYEVPKKTLQLEVKRVAQFLGHVPTREEYLEFGTYEIRLYDEYFPTWSDACAAAKTTGMTETKNPNSLD